MAEQTDLFFKREAISNNTFDFDTEIKAIEECKLSSFQYLYQIQKEMTRYKRFDFHMSDLQRCDMVNHKLSLAPRKWVLYVPGDFLDDDDRLRYHPSGFSASSCFPGISPDYPRSPALPFFSQAPGLSALCLPDPENP